MKNKEVDIFIIHEKPDMAWIIANSIFQENLDTMLNNTEFALSVPEALGMLNDGLRPKTIIAHKGMETNGNDVDVLVEGMDSIEGLQNTRLGFVSGEFFGEHVCQTARRLGANFGWDMTAYGPSHPVPDWVISIVKLGYPHPIELERRGKEIIISARMASDRLQLLGISQN